MQTNHVFINSKYRHEIDGIRAFAVIAVIINHFNKNILPGGYLGVDIFFVISGYVITSSLLLRRSNNLWDFIFGFYARRIKRLFPALIVFVLITSVLICFFQSSPGISLKTGLASLFGLSNIYLFKLSTDYFAGPTELNVFTHTWSLGVEEQFYIFFPFITWFTGFSRQTSSGARNLFLSILFLIICSLITFIYLYSINQPAAYFLMPTRFWEMALGSLVFLTFQKKGLFKDKLEKFSPSIVLILIIGVMFLPVYFAVFSTILEVILTAILISCLREGKLFSFFTSKNITKIGSISYSLYLWHWGVLSISRQTIGIHWWSIPFQIVIIYFLAVISYKWVENPFIKKNWSSEKHEIFLKGIFALLLSSLTLGALGKPLKGKLFLGVIKTDLKKTDVEMTQPKFNGCYNMKFKKAYNHEKVLNNCLTKFPDKNQTLLFLGDSHNHYLLSGSKFVANETNSNLLSFSYPGTLFPVVNDFEHNIQKGGKFKFREIFKSFEKDIFLNISKGDVFFINIRYGEYFEKHWFKNDLNSYRVLNENHQLFLRNSNKRYFEVWLNSFSEFIEALDQKGVKVVISTPTPEFPKVTFKQCKGQNDQWFNKLSKTDCSISRSFFVSEKGKYSYLLRGVKKIASEHNNLFLFDAFSAMCPNEKCDYILENKFLYDDDNHISHYAGRYIIGPRLLDFIKENKILSF